MTLDPFDLDNYSRDIVKHYTDSEQKIINKIINSFADNAKHDKIKANENDLVNYASSLVQYSKNLRNNVHTNITSASNEDLKPVKQFVSEHTKHVKEPSGWANRLRKSLLNTDKYMAMVGVNMTSNTADVVRRVTTEATTAFNLGKITKEEAVKRALHNWVNDSVQIPALKDVSGKNWSPETYVRTVINTQANNLANAEELKYISDNCRYVDISAHMGARPLCAPYQGKRYSMYDNDKKYPSFYTTSYGQIAGILGINCKHHLLPVANDGAIYNPINYGEQENSEAYKLLQKQRELERNIRHLQSRKSYARAFGTDDEVREYTSKIKDAKGQIIRLVNQHDLQRQPARETNYINEWFKAHNTDNLTESQKIVNKKIIKNEWPLYINEDKQARHVESTHKKGRSYFADSVDLKKLVELYAGTGELRKKDLSSDTVEMINNISLPGAVLDVSGKKYHINSIGIHYSNKGLHIVPMYSRR